MSATRLLRRALDALLDVVAPRDCAVCGEATGSGLCEPCRALLLPPSPRNIDGVPLVAGASYAPPLDGVLWRMKYENRPDLAPVLADLVRPELAALGLDASTRLVPVPLHPNRLVERGYDQACLLAQSLARGSPARYLPRALERRADTPQQARLTRENRRLNVEHAFVARHPTALAGRRVVLIDDVVTTGATVRSCLRALQRSGAVLVGIACVAIADKRAESSPRQQQDC